MKALLFGAVTSAICYAKIQIFNPERLKVEAGADVDGYIESGLANFGHIDYGSSIVSASTTLFFLL